jgi:hypothetical protein
LSDGTLRIWDWSTNTILFTLPWIRSGNSNSAGNIKFLSNGSLLAAPFNSTTISVWNTSTGQVKYSLAATFLSAEQLSNANLMISGTDNFIRIWSITTGRLLLQVNTGALHYALKQTSTTNLVASGCSDNKIYIWDINTLSPVYMLTGHSNQVNFIESIPTGGLVLSGSLDNTLILWNVTVPTALNSLSVSDSITCLKMISDSQLVVGFAANYIRFVNITSANTLISAQTVNLVTTNSQVKDMRLTMENILLMTQTDGSVFFMNTNTSTVIQAVTPVGGGSAVAYNLDLIG